MRILHLALGGCLKAPPVNYGVTADTGGHIAYVLDAAFAQARQPGVDHVTIVTRLFEDVRLPAEHGMVSQALTPKVTIDRVATADRRYLEKEALAAELPDFTVAFCDYLSRQMRLPDVIHAHFADAAEVAIAARRRFGIRVVYTPHALGIDKRRKAVASAALDVRIEQERRAIAEADAIIVSSRDEADRQVNAYAVAVGTRIHRVPPGVPVRPDSPTSATLVDRLDRWLDRPELPIVLAIARPVHKKNLAALVRGYATTAGLRDRANLVILAGQHDRELGEEEQAVIEGLRELIDAHGLHGRVVLPATHDAADVSALYALAAVRGVFVNPALHEPFGLTLIEAAAAGVPVVATHNGGPQEIVPTIGHGLLIDPADDAAIGEACLRIVSDPDLHGRLRAAALANVGRYDWAQYAQASVAIYAKIRTAHPVPIAGQASPRLGLLACDIDNTLTGCAQSARTFARWRMRSELPFVIATGRSFDDARAVMARWALPEPDAYIVDVGTRIMRRTAIGQWRACADYAAMLDRGWDRRAIVATLHPLAITPQAAETDGPHKISFFGGRADAARIREALDAGGSDARVILSHGRLIDVLPRSGGKAAAIAAYATGLGLSLRQCIAAGDSGNDADMLAACGQAIVVGNASDELADLPVRPGLYRARRHHAAGVLEGLARLGLIVPPTPILAIQASMAVAA